MTGPGGGSTRFRPSDLLWPLAVLVAVVVLALFSLGTRGGLGWGYDLGAYTDAADRLVRSLPLYQPITQQGPFEPGPGGLYLYAPQLAVALLPLTAQAVGDQVAVWTVLHIGALVVACAAMPVRRTVRAATLIAAALCYPGISDMVLGNVSTFVFLASVLTWRWLERPLGSIALAAGMTIRPTLGILLVTWALRRTWRPIVWTVLAGLLLVAVTLPFAGLDAYLGYLTMLRNLTVGLAINQNSTVGSSAWQAGVPAEWADRLQLASYLFALVVVVASARRDAQTAFAGGVAASLLLSPLMWSHYLLSLLVPLALLVERGHRWVLLLFATTWIPVLLSGANLIYPLLVFIVAALVTWLPDHRLRQDRPGPNAPGRPSMGSRPQLMGRATSGWGRLDEAKRDDADADREPDRERQRPAGTCLRDPVRHCHAPQVERIRDDDPEPGETPDGRRLVRRTRTGHRRDGQGRPITRPISAQMPATREPPPTQSNRAATAATAGTDHRANWRVRPGRLAPAMRPSCPARMPS